MSADGPIRPPYEAYVQGGLTYEHVKLAVTRSYLFKRTKFDIENVSLLELSRDFEKVIIQYKLLVIKDIVITIKYSFYKSM